MTSTGQLAGVKYRLTFMLLAAVAAIAIAASVGAGAARAEHGCPAGYGCGWVDGSYGIPMGKWAGNNNNLSIFTQSACQTGNWNDCISSIWNEGTSCNLTWWTNSGYSGNGYRNNRGTGTGFLSPEFWNDEFSSDRWCEY